jgi:hypothetical protein
MGAFRNAAAFRHRGEGSQVLEIMKGLMRDHGMMNKNRNLQQGTMGVSINLLRAPPFDP